MGDSCRPRLALLALAYLHTNRSRLPPYRSLSSSPHPLLSIPAALSPCDPPLSSLPVLLFSLSFCLARSLCLSPVLAPPPPPPPPANPSAPLSSPC